MSRPGGLHLDNEERIRLGFPPVFPMLKFGSRGEEINYVLNGKSLWIGYTWAKGPRIYPATIDKWENSDTPLDAKQRANILHEAILFINQNGEKPIVIINVNDPFRRIWETVCSGNLSSIEGVQYTSDKELAQAERQMFLDILKAGKKLVLDGVEIGNESDLDEYIRSKGA